MHINVTCAQSAHDVTTVWRTLFSHKALWHIADVIPYCVLHERSVRMNAGEMSHQHCLPHECTEHHNSLHERWHLCVTFTPNKNTTPQALSHSKSKENEPKRARAHTHNFMHDGSSVHDVTDHDWQAPLWCQAKIVTSHVKHSLQLRVQLRSSRARLWCFVTVAPALFPSPRMHPWNILLEYFGLARCIRN